MIKRLRIHFNQVLETWKREGFFSVLHTAFFINKEIVPVEKHLNSLKSTNFPSGKKNFKFIEILKDKAGNAHLIYPLKSRYLKMAHNLDMGYRGFAIIKGDEVIGDIWYLSPNSSKEVIKQPDLKLLNITLNEKEAYMFDMFVMPAERGCGLVNFLLGNALIALKTKGFIKVYGFYMADNIPALWVHRTLGYKELKKFKVQRILFLNFKSFKKLIVAI